MHIDWWTLGLQTVNFAVLVWLLHRFLYQPVLRMVDARRAEIESQYNDAQSAAAKAQAEAEAIAAERAGIAAERTAALDLAAEQANQAAAAVRAQAEQDAAALLKEARRGIDNECKEALARAREAALDLGLDVARRLLAQAPRELRAEAWLDRVEQHLNGLPASALQEVSSGLDEGQLRVVTPVPLSAEAQQTWRARLQHTLKARPQIRFEVDESILAGAELHFPRAILRLSWRSALAAIRAELEQRPHDAHRRSQILVE